MPREGSIKSRTNDHKWVKMVPAILPKVTQFHKSFEMRQNSFSKLTIETTSSCKFQPYPKHLSTLGLLSFFLANTVRFLCYTLYVFKQWQSLFRLRFAALKVGNSALQFDTALSIRKSASTAQEQRPSNIIIPRTMGLEPHLLCQL